MARWVSGSAEEHRIDEQRETDRCRSRRQPVGSAYSLW
jgi:hypothetical protein